MKKIDNNFKIRLINFILTTAILISVFGFGYRLGESKSKSILSKITNNQEIRNFDLFWDVWNQLEKKYVDKNKLDAKKMYYGAIKGLVASLEDSYTFFLTPEENQQAKNDLQGKFEGIGAQLGLKNNQVIVISPLKNSPAEKAGVKPGDYIIKVNDKPTKDWTLNETVSKIRGPKGTKVKLTLLRKDQEINLEIIRDQIIVPSVEIDYENNVAILKLNQFGDNTNNEWDNAVDNIKEKWEKKQIKGMILDLRNNPGGYLESSIYLASEFLPINQLVVKQESYNSNKEYKVFRKGKLLDIPLVVLINEGSASASEILAGALRDYNRAKLVGQKSFGKGSIQEAVDLKDGAGLHLTIAKWILPKGDWINSKGIEPNIKIENKVDEGNTLSKETDQQLKKAIELLK